MVSFATLRPETAFALARAVLRADDSDPDTIAAATYEQPAACVPPASEVTPHLGLDLVSSPRPERNPRYE